MKFRPPIERVLQKVEIDAAGCWIFVGSRTKAGYGMVGVGSKVDGTNTRAMAHRVVYEATVGPIPVGWHIDHLCRVHPCVNPDHLEAVTAQENLRRGVGFNGQNARKTHCKWGHPLSGDNLRMSRGKSGPQRKCRTCDAYHRAARNRQRRAAAASRRMEAAQSLIDALGGVTPFREVGNTKEKA